MLMCFRVCLCRYVVIMLFSDVVVSCVVVVCRCLVVRDLVSSCCVMLMFSDFVVELSSLSSWLAV